MERMVVDMRMSRQDRKEANFLLRAIKAYGIHDFDVHDSNVREAAYIAGRYYAVSYLVTVGDNVVSIDYYYRHDNDCFVCVCLNDYPLTRSKVACCPDMIPIVNTFAALVQHLN